MSNELSTITQAQRMLAEATTVDELKDVRAFASAMQSGARARKLGIEAENKAAEVVLRAEREIGKHILALKDSGAIRMGAPKKVLGGDEVETTLTQVTGLHAHDKRLWEWQQVASLDDEVFERLLSEARHLKERIAKVNFYRVRAKAKDESAGKTKEDSGFLQLRAGAYALLGWQVDATGEGGPTKNGLLALPNDELLAVANIIRALADAYNEVRKVR
jgi:hypothetical protein